MATSLLVIAMLAAAPDVTAEVDAIWKPLQPAPVTGKPTSWSWRLTPAIPAEWTPKSNSAPVIRYAYAAMFDPSLHDGERTTAPFAMIEIAPDGSTKVSGTMKTLGKLEVQGVKPITKDEADRMKGDLIEPARAGQMGSLRMPWCLWLRYNGVVGADLKTRHPEFFAALKCDEMKSSK